MGQNAIRHVVAIPERGAHLDHDHSEGKHIRLFACDAIPKQDFWGRPPRGMSFVGLGAHGVFAMRDRCEAKITDACVAGAIY